MERSWSLLRPGGWMISVAMAVGESEAQEHGVRGLFFIVEPNRAQLEEMGRLVDQGTLKVFVAKVFPLAQARAAFELALEAHTRGKIVLEVKN